MFRHPEEKRRDAGMQMGIAGFSENSISLYRFVIDSVQYRIKTRRSAEIGQSGFLHTPGTGKTDNTVSNQWRIGIIYEPIRKLKRDFIL